MVIANILSHQNIFYILTEQVLALKHCPTAIITMANKAPYQTTFEPEHTIQPIYTGGSVALDQSGRILATTLGEDALLTDLNTGRQLAKIEGVCLRNHSSSYQLTCM